MRLRLCLEDYSFHPSYASPGFWYRPDAPNEPIVIKTRVMSIGRGQPTVPFNVVGVALAPAEPGVYAICRADGSYIYFGETADLQKRLTQHLIDVNSGVYCAGAAFFAYEIQPSPGGRIARRDQLISMYAAGC